jgi:putative Holliday junction resolvase
VLAVDVGTVRWGLAVSDELGLLAHPVGTVPAGADAVAAVAAKAAELGVARIVVGWPRRTDGAPGALAEEVRRLCEEIQRVSRLPVAVWDERLTTVAADRLLLERGHRRLSRRRLVDQVAATLILQSYLDARRSQPR